MLRRLGVLGLLAIGLSGGCYSHTREVVLQPVATAPVGCRHAEWVPPAGGSAGYWRCVL